MQLSLYCNKILPVALIKFNLHIQVAVNTPLTDLHQYLEHLLKSTNMKSLTPDKALSGECGFMAANLYAKSIFGEDALANVSLEKNMLKPDAPVTGKFLCRLFPFQSSWGQFLKDLIPKCALSNTREWQRSQSSIS